MTQKFNFNALALFIFSILFTACHSRKVEYSLKKIEVVQDQKLSSIVLDIETFNDKRKDYEKNNVLFKPVMQQTPNERKWSWNVDKAYENAVPEALANMLAEHWRQRGSFKSVKVNRKDSSDYYMECDLHFFYAAQKSRSLGGMAVVGVLLPILAIPVLVYAATEKTKTVVIIDLKNLKIYNRKQELIFNTDLVQRYEGKCRTWGGHKAIYRNANKVLKEYYTELIPLIEKEIRKAEER